MTDGTMAVMPERWTQERRREHTRSLLLDAAEEVFTAKGFEGASLDEIADRAGYTRGAIYKHFADKADLFLEMNSRFNEQVFSGFQDVIDAGIPTREFDVAEIAKRWHAFQQPFERSTRSAPSSTCTCCATPRSVSGWWSSDVVSST